MSSISTNNQAQPDPPAVKAGGLAATFKTLQKTLRRFLLSRFTPPQEIDDLVQEVYACLLQYVPDIQQLRSPKSYVLTVARNVLRQHWIVAKQQQVIELALQSGEETAETLIDDEDTPQESYEKHQRRQQIEKAIAELSPQQKAVFIMKVRDHLPIKEIAHRLRTSESATYSHYMRALKTLNQKVNSQ